MPIAASAATMIPQFISAFSMGSSATPSAIGSKITQAIAAAAATGLFPVPPPVNFIPLVAGGASAAQPLISMAFASTLPIPSVMAAQIASAIALIAPMCPPSGMSTLQNSILNNVLTGGQSVTPTTMANNLAQAVVQYYQAGTIV